MGLSNQTPEGVWKGSQVSATRELSFEEEIRILTGSSMRDPAVREMLTTMLVRFHPGVLLRVTTAAKPMLTDRELEVLALAAKGHTNPGIASTLRISVQTVKGHFTNVLGKLGVTDRTTAVTLALRRGYLHLDDL